MTIEQDLSRVLAWLDRSTAMDHDDANHEAAQFLSNNRDSIRSALADQRRLRGAAVVIVRTGYSPGHGGGSELYTIGSDYDPGNPMKSYVGKRVAIVPLDQEGE